MRYEPDSFSKYEEKTTRSKNEYVINLAPDTLKSIDFKHYVDIPSIKDDIDVVINEGTRMYPVNKFFDTAEKDTYDAMRLTFLLELCKTNIEYKPGWTIFRKIANMKQMNILAVNAIDRKSVV